MTRTGRVLIMAILLLVAVPSSGSAITPVEPTPPSDLGGALPFEGTRWILRSYRAQNGSTAVPIVEASITFAHGRAQGFAGCHGFGGGYTLDGVHMALEGIATRAFLCTDAAITGQDVAVLDGLERTSSWWRDRTDLVLYDAAGAELLRYLALEPRIWVPVWTDGEPVPEAYVRIRFSKGEVWIQSPCNRMGGAYTQDGSALAITITFRNMMSCGDLMDAREQAFVDELAATRAYTIDAGTLVLLDADGNAIRRFTEWVVG